MVLMHLDLKNGPFLPHNLISVQGSSVLVLKFQMATTIHYSVQVILSFQYYNCKLNYEIILTIMIMETIPDLVHYYLQGYN